MTTKRRAATAKPTSRRNNTNNAAADESAAHQSAAHNDSACGDLGIVARLRELGYVIIAPPTAPPTPGSAAAAAHAALPLHNFPPSRAAWDGKLPTLLRGGGEPDWRVERMDTCSVNIVAELAGQVCRAACCCFPIPPVAGGRRRSHTAGSRGQSLRVRGRARRPHARIEMTCRTRIGCLHHDEVKVNPAASSSASRCCRCAARSSYACATPATRSARAAAACAGCCRPRPP